MRSLGGRTTANWLHPGHGLHLPGMLRCVAVSVGVSSASSCVFVCVVKETYYRGESRVCRKEASCASGSADARVLGSMRLNPKSEL